MGVYSFSFRLDCCKRSLRAEAMVVGSLHFNECMVGRELRFANLHAACLIASGGFYLSLPVHTLTHTLSLFLFFFLNLCPPLSLVVQLITPTTQTLSSVDYSAYTVIDVCVAASGH